MTAQTYKQRAENERTKAANPVAHAVSVTTKNGEKQVLIDPFPALEGYEITRAYRHYVQSKEPDFRRNFILTVLSYASVDDQRLNSAETINKKLETWRNVETVFFAVLESNDIDSELEEEKNDYWAASGVALATSFIAASAKLLLPLMETMEDEKNET